MKKFYLFLWAATACLPIDINAQHFVLKSPDGDLEINVNADGELAYSLKHKGKLLLGESPIGLVLKDNVLECPVKVRKADERYLKTEDIQSPHYRVPSFTVTYNELDLKMKGNYGVVFRAYNEGMAYRSIQQ